mgnify:CR=1 FL=1|jgi:hypothetical protein
MVVKWRFDLLCCDPSGQAVNLSAFAVKPLNINRHLGFTVALDTYRDTKNRFSSVFEAIRP